MAEKQTRDILFEVENLYRDRSSRARELKKQGKKIIGYFCCYTPVEFITAAGMVPFRITGDASQVTTKSDGYVERILCPFVRSAFEMGLQGKYDFLDGFVLPHGCDNLSKIYDIWKYYLEPPFTHFVNVPHTLTDASMEFFHKELERFKEGLEKFSGNEISLRSITEAIKIHNENRALVRELYELRKPDPPLLSGTDITRILVDAVSMPVAESNQILRGIIDEVKSSGESTNNKGPRILLWGSELDDVAFVQMIEESGANVVADDICFGSRCYRDDVIPGDDSLSALAQHYLHDITCPRIYRKRTGGRQEDLENRFGYLRDLVKEFNADAVIMYIIRFCDTFEFDVPDVRDFLESEGIRSLHIEDEYSMLSIARLKTRVQAFLEMIG